MGRLRSLWVAAVVVLAAIAVPSVARADHFRGGYIIWKLLPSPANTVEFQSVQVWRAGAVTPLEINPGVGSDVTIIGPVSTIFTAVDAAGESYTMIQYRVRYTYPSAGPFTAFLGIGTHDVTCCRIQNLINVPDQPQRIATVVDLGGGNTGSPVPAIPMLLKVDRGCPNSVPLPIAPDPEGFTCSLAGDGPTGAGTTAGIVPMVPTPLTVSPGCVLSWTPMGAVGAKYALQVLIDEGGASNGQVAVDFIIEIREGQCCGNDIRQGSEICDGTDDAACPGGCQANCTCCGDGVREPSTGEICDQTDDAECPGGCQVNCSCCGDGIVESAVGEVCDGASDAACFPTPGLGCASNCQCAVPGGGGGGCTDSCANDVSVCSGLSGPQTIDVGQLFTSPFVGTDPCDTLFVNDPPWGLLPPGAGIFGGTPGGPAPGSMQAPPSTGTCSHNPNITCSTCQDCNGCTHDPNVNCTTNADCSMSPGSTCVTGATCTKGPNQFPVTFSWTPAPNQAAQTFGATITFTPPGFTVPGGTQYFCDFQIHVRGCGDDVIDPGEACDGTQNAACGVAPCLPPGHPNECQCPVCGDGELNRPDEECDGAAADDACPGACLPNCVCATCGDNDVNQGSEQCDGSDAPACPGRCLPTCICAVCGDGIVHPGIGERCEPTNDAACPGDCLPPGDPNECRCRGCGDGDVNQPSEQCDGTDDAACPGLCLTSCLCPTCGDGAVNQPSEQCDGAAAAACPGLCRPPGDPNQCRCPVCGDGDVNRPSEQCDDVDDAACPGLCLASCLCPTCGDGAINQPGEQCDGADAAACVGECRPPGDPNQCRCPVCGDGDVNRPSEQCDTTDDAACPGLCLASCLCPVCGDGLLSPPSEQCEAGNDAACPGQCRPPGDPNACRCPVCGDGDVNQVGEQCDGADAAACPGLCSADCTCAVCGDGIISPPVEDCDAINDAACPGQCAPPGDPNACRCPRCGDGVVNQPSEECDGAAIGACATGVCQPDCTYAACGNCALDPGEQCDPPSREICNNLVDDDGDGKINCDDTDCTPGRTCKHPSDPVVNALVSTLACASSLDCNAICSHDLATPCLTSAACNALMAGSFCIDGARCNCPDVAPGGFETCGATCAPVFGCRCIRNDPARIRFGKPGQPDLLKIHGRFLFDSTMDPPSDGFTLLLANTAGIVYQGTLVAGDLVGTAGQYKFTDRLAKTGAGTRDGLFRVIVRIKRVKGVINYVFKAQAYGDFSSASTFMTTQIIAGNDTASLSGEWSRSSAGWKLISFE